MSPSTMRADGYAGNRTERRARKELFSDEEPGGQCSGWLEEEFDAPEAWTLASFDDLLPSEMI